MAIPSKVEDLIGTKFGKLTISHEVDKEWWGGCRRTFVLCVCDCGGTKVCPLTLVKNSKVKSCGCLAGGANSHSKDKKLASVWSSIKERVSKPSCKAYKNYGGRGIRMCPEWFDSVDNFYNWAMSSGYEPGLSIERLDVNKDYCPDNCGWIPRSEQSRNKRRYSNNTTGVTGVFKQTLSSGTEVYRAQWSDNGKLKSKAFSTKIYGEQGAFELACYAREEGLKSLESKGIVYADSHGS